MDFHSSLFSISIFFQFTTKLVLASILFVLPSHPHDPYLSLGDADILNSGFKLFLEYRGSNKQALESPLRARREKAVGGAQTLFNTRTYVGVTHLAKSLGRSSIYFNLSLTLGRGVRTALS